MDKQQMDRVTHDQARAAFRRLIHSRVGNDDPARNSIPARPDYDDDLLLARYIEEQAVIDASQGPGQIGRIDMPDGLHADTQLLITRFSTALAEKLRKSEIKYGYSAGWKRPDWLDECRQHLIDHIGKGDPRDVAAYCAFLWWHGSTTASHAPAVSAQSDPQTWLSRLRSNDYSPNDVQAAVRYINHLRGGTSIESPTVVVTTLPEGSKPAGYVKPDTDRQIYFYEQDFYVLSNFSAFRLEWKGISFATSEQAYHWEKFTNPDAREVQRDVQFANSAHEAFKIAERNRAMRLPHWDEIKVDVMRDILRAKVDQHEYVRRKLLGTGDRELIEDSWRDDFWGWGPNKDGCNTLGKLWMEIRSELRQAEVSTESNWCGVTGAGTDGTREAPRQNGTLCVSEYIRIYEELCPDDHVHSDDPRRHAVMNAMRAIHVAATDREAAAEIEWWDAWPNQNHQTVHDFVRQARRLMRREDRENDTVGT